MNYELCDNAVKYNTPGGKVTVYVSSKGDEVFLSVADTGIGIPLEHRSAFSRRKRSVQCFSRRNDP